MDFDYSSNEKHIPYICIDREPKTREDTVFISSNHYQGAFEATEELIHVGCKHPLIVMHDRKSTSTKKNGSTALRMLLKKIIFPFLLKNIY